MLKVLIIDDEPPAIQALKNIITELENIEIIGTYTDPLEGINAISKLKPDVVFLDIEMPIHNGLTVAKQTEHINYNLVYVTAYPEHALSAFETNVTDYLLKPVRPSRLIQCIEKINKRATSVTVYPVIKVFDGSTSYNLDSEQITLIESLGRYQQIHLTPKGAKSIGHERLIVEKSIANFEEELNHPNFYRVHRGFIIRLDKIHKIISRDRNKYFQISDFDKEIPVSRSKFKALSEENLI